MDDNWQKLGNVADRVLKTLSQTTCIHEYIEITHVGSDQRNFVCTKCEKRTYAEFVKITH